jgi:hypothetical protein
MSADHGNGVPEENLIDELARLVTDFDELVEVD